MSSVVSVNTNMQWWTRSGGFCLHLARCVPSSRAFPADDDGAVGEHDPRVDDRVVCVRFADAARARFVAVGADLEFRARLQPIARAEAGERVWAQGHHHARLLALGAGDRDRLAQLRGVSGRGDEHLVAAVLRRGAIDGDRGARHERAHGERERGRAAPYPAGTAWKSVPHPS
jgi:hypothetical protein